MSDKLSKLRVSDNGRRTGNAIAAGEISARGERMFTPPANQVDAGLGDDWVLVLDDASKGYPIPGGAQMAYVPISKSAQTPVLRRRHPVGGGGLRPRDGG